MSDFRINWLIPLKDDHSQGSIIEQTIRIITDKGVGNYICVYIKIDGTLYACVVKFDEGKVCSDCRHDFVTNRDDDTETSEAIARSVFDQMGCHGVNDDRAKEDELKRLIVGRQNVQMIIGDKQTIRKEVADIFKGTIQIDRTKYVTDEEYESSFVSDESSDDSVDAIEVEEHSEARRMSTPATFDFLYRLWGSEPSKIPYTEREPILLDPLLVCSDHGTKATLKSCGNNVRILMPKKIDVGTSYNKKDYSTEEIRVNSSETYRVGAFTVSHDRSVSAALFIEHGFNLISGEYYTQTSFYNKGAGNFRNIKDYIFQEENIVFNISKIVNLVKMGRISPSNGGLAKFIADRLPLILHILKKCDICNQDSTILIETHDTRAFIDICKPLIYDSRHGDFREVEMTTLFARKITKDYLGDRWATVIVYGSSDLSHETVRRIRANQAKQIEEERAHQEELRQQAQQEVEELKRILNEELDEIQQFMTDSLALLGDGDAHEQGQRESRAEQREQHTHSKDRGSSRSRSREGRGKVKVKSEFKILCHNIDVALSNLVVLRESSRIFNLEDNSDYHALRVTLKYVMGKMVKFRDLVQEREKSGVFLKIEEFISKLNNAGGGARSRSKRGKCQYGKNKITKHRRIRSKNNKMKRKNKITKKIINNRKR